MANNNQPEQGRSRRLSGQGMQRIVVLGVLFGVVTFLILFAKLWQLQVVEHEKLEQQAISQQTREVASSANRGTIYDANGAILAISGSVQNVILSPKDVLTMVEDDVETEDEFGNPRSQAVIDAEKKQKAQELWDLIADGLSAILEIEREEVIKRLEKTDRKYEVLAEKVEDEMADQVRAFVAGNKLSQCIYLTEDSKRYYPYSTTASQIVGFVNRQNKGSYGLEALYENELSGEDGRTIIAKNAAGTEMNSAYSSFTDAIDGYNVHTTIDATIQMYAEKIVEEGIRKFDVINGAFCIVMEPDTGAVLAMVSYPDYDLNDPDTVVDPVELAKLATLKNDPTMNEEDYAKAYNDACLKQWANKCLNTTYEPGSTFKACVVAAALEEGVISEDDTFHCTGGVEMDGWYIRCSARRGHGTQDLRKAVMNSCNPAFIEIGQRLGAEKFYQYWENFGFADKTGIELPGEFSSYFWPEEEFVSPAGVVSLATASFGQRFTTTPIHLITALSATVNGGHLMEPYVVQSITDQQGNVVSYHEPTEVRQVVSEDTSAQVRSFLESVVHGHNGTGKNARVAGYRIGGKTGSSQNIDSKDHIIVSFAGMAPADDPEIIVLLAYDWPQPFAPGMNRSTTGYYISGGDMAAPMAGELISDILDYLGHEKTATGGENVGITVPRLTEKTVAEAKASLAELGLNAKISGEGEAITDQAPAPGSSVPKGSTVVLYLGTPKAEETVPMPDLAGMTYEKARKTLEEVGLYLEATGASDGGKVFSQSVEPGAPLAIGTVVEVKFADETPPDDPLEGDELWPAKEETETEEEPET